MKGKTHFTPDRVVHRVGLLRSTFGAASHTTDRSRTSRVGDMVEVVWSV